MHRRILSIYVSMHHKCRCTATSSIHRSILVDAPSEHGGASALSAPCRCTIAAAYLPIHHNNNAPSCRCTAVYLSIHPRNRILVHTPTHDFSMHRRVDAYLLIHRQILVDSPAHTYRCTVVEKLPMHRRIPTDWPPRTYACQATREHDTGSSRSTFGGAPPLDRTLYRGRSNG